MKIISTILSLFIAAAFLTGCGARSYTHDVYADGKLTEHYGVTIIENAYDAKANSAALKLPDGATLDLNAPSGQVDANVMSAVQSWGQSFIAFGAVALKIAGVLP